MTAFDDIENQIGQTDGITGPRSANDLDGLAPVSAFGQAAIERGESIALPEELVKQLGLRQPAPQQTTDEFGASEAENESLRIAQEAAPPASRFTAMSSGDFSSLLDEVKAGAQIDNPGEAVDSEWFADIADVFPRDLEE